MTKIGPALVSVLLASACGDAVAPAAEASGDTSTDTSSSSSSETTDDPTTGAPEAVCCGCLCIDPAWSCATDTCVTADGTVTALAPEAGFLAIAPHGYTTFTGTGDPVVHEAPEARQWYVFRPADDHPEERPLAVFFNGGPGNSSAILFGLNTNAITLDPDIAGDAIVAANPHSWTRFANVLYLDPREAGYSYDIARADAPLVEFTPERDASDFVRVLLAFLARHPQIQRNPVVLVGESYGGTRSAVMLAQILRPERLGDGNRYRDEALRDALRRHFAAVFPDADPTTLPPETIARQFGHQVMIQPALTWLVVHGAPYTPDEQQFIDLECIPEPDVGQCDEPFGWSAERVEAVIAALTNPRHLAIALGVDVTTIAWMYADARAAARPRPSPPIGYDDSALRATFGELAANEYYYHPVRSPDSSSWMDWIYGQIYLETMYFARTFMTDAGKDTVVYAPDIPGLLAMYGHVVTSVEHDQTTTPGEDRPGWLRLDYVPAIAPGEPRRDVRFPHYPTAGHMVSHKQGGAFAADVCHWMMQDCPLP